MYVALCPATLTLRCGLGGVVLPGPKVTDFVQKDPPRTVQQPCLHLETFHFQKKSSYFLFSLTRIKPPNQAIKLPCGPDNCHFTIALVGLLQNQLGDKREAAIKICHQAQVPSPPVSQKPLKHLAPHPLQMCADHSQRSLSSWDYSRSFSRN